jgi:hypothetical protein
MIDPSLNVWLILKSLINQTFWQVNKNLYPKTQAAGGEKGEEDARASGGVSAEGACKKIGTGEAPCPDGSQQFR